MGRDIPEFYELMTAPTTKVIEPPHDKTNKIMGAQRRLRSAWAFAQSDQSSLCTQWVAKEARFLHADSEDWSDCANVQADLSLCWAHIHFVGFVMRRLICFFPFNPFLPDGLLCGCQLEEYMCHLRGVLFNFVIIFL